MRNEESNCLFRKVTVFTINHLIIENVKHPLQMFLNILKKTFSE